MSRQKRKTPKVEAWALVDAKGEICSLQTDEWWPAYLLDRHTRVRLVPADPAKERALRAADIRTLAQTPPSGRYVPDEVLAQVKDAMEEAVDLFEDAAIGDYVPDSFTPQPLRAALAALEDGREKHGT